MDKQISFSRTLSLKTTTAIVISSIIGSGIFMRPAEMAALLGSPWQVMAVWVVAGIFTMLTAMILAEMASVIPEDGGTFAIMYHTYGKFWGYLYGWACFAVINCAGTAAIAFIASQYFEYFITLPRFSEATELSFVWHIPLVGDLYPLQNAGVKMLTIFLLAVFTLISYRSTKSSGRMQEIFSIVKAAGIIFIVVGLFASGKGSFSNFAIESTTINPSGLALVAALVAACNGALQALDGCNNMLNLTGEIKDPGRNIPRALFYGLSVCIIVYLLINAALFYILPVDTMAGSELVASDAAEIALGSIGAGLIALLICIAVAGTTSSNVFSPPRITYAMARQGIFFPMAGKIHPRFKTPANALLLHFVVMALMVISGSFFILADMYIFIVWAFNLMLMVALFIMRKRFSAKERPYSVWGYPWIPILVLLFNSFYLVVTLVDDINNYLEGKTALMNSVFGIFVTVIGIPLYWLFRRKNSNKVV